MTEPARRPLSATYRLQMRNGVGFDEAAAALPYLADLGISHLYLSPIFTADEGSTHGYDITDPSAIDPVLGGEAGFARLAEATAKAGLSIILDIVPNHTAFSLNNPWLLDVLRHGRQSRWARHFDIDWSRRLVLPFLPRPFEEMLDAGAVSLGQDADGAPVLRVDIDGGGFAVPMAPVSTIGRGIDAMRAHHDAQVWQLSHWERERDDIAHRRFFNITGLIGMRVESEQVFRDTHALTLRLVREGLVQGLRLDHVDGLADPEGYLTRLREAVGPDVPIWVEKILTGDEPLPADWPVQGTTGYEAARQIARILTPLEGLAALDTGWRAATGFTGSFADTVAAAKDEIITMELAAELHQLIELAAPAVVETRRLEPGPEALREAVLAVLTAFPRYRAYVVDSETGALGDRRLMTRVIEAASKDLRSDEVLRALGDAILAPDGPAARDFARRFHQVTGALTAKSQEDTAFFRFNRCLATNEVGAEPDEATITPAQLESWLKHRQQHWPVALTLTSSHDTKRSEDARMRLVAAAQDPGSFLALWQAEVPHLSAIGPNEGWYLLQSCLAIWEDGRDDISERLASHMEKALREAKLITNWPYPDAGAETPVLDAARAIAGRWGDKLPVPARRLIARAEPLILTQVALKAMMPGIPDFYQGTETGAFHLTDPDNRAPVDFAVQGRADERPGLDGAKARLTRALIGLRAEHAGFFRSAEVELAPEGDALCLVRQAGDRRIALHFRPDGSPVAARPKGASLLPDAQDWPFRLTLQEVAATIRA